MTAGSARWATLAEAWDALADRTGAAPFDRPGWVHAWWRSFGRGRLRVLTVADGGDLKAVIPTRIAADAHIATPTNWHTPVFGAVALDDEAAKRLMGRLVASRPYRADLSFLDAAGPTAAAAAAAAGEAGFRVLSRTLLRSPFVELSSGWVAFLDALPGKVRREVRRRLRRLRERGEVTFDVEHDLRTTSLDEGLAVEAAGWKGRLGSAIASSPATDRFYREVARWAASRGWLRLCFLRAEGRPIAFDLALEADGRHYLLKTGFDPAFATYAPGILLRYEMIRRAFDQGLASYEFLGTNDLWKETWATGRHDRILLQLFAPSPAGSAAWAVYRFGRPAAATMLRVARGRVGGGS